ncbi:MAG TPA: hypothetical protein VI299_11595 [Polyangiales bacterium]
MSSNEPGIVKRKNVRWKATPTDCAYLSFEPASRAFTPELCGLIVDQSHRGCCLIVLADPRVVKGAFARVQLGQLDPLVGILRWVSNLDTTTLRIGFEFP